MKRYRSAAVAALIFSTVTLGVAQTGTSANSSQDEVSTLRQQLQQTQEQLTQSVSEIRELRAMMERMQGQLNALSGREEKTVSEPPAQAAAPASQAATITSDDWQLLNAKVEEQQQVKVESASKFRVKLSGMLLLTAFSTAGTVDNVDVPEFAYHRPPAWSHGSSGASLRQSILGLSATGPELVGARTSADIQLDFYGGSASGYSQYSSGLARLRLARMRFDWQKTSIIGGLDYTFFSPNSPTSYMSVAEPAFSGSGNLWTWVPTIRVEQRQKLGSAQIKFEAGLIDYAAYEGNRSAAGRSPTPGESTRQPGYSVRVSANRPGEDNPIAFGVGGIYIPQRFAGGREVSGWGGSLDWCFPVTSRAEITGEFFTGRGINGFGGTTLGQLPTQDMHYSFVSAPNIATLLSLGGWSQFKFKVDSRNEFNAAAGYGGFLSNDLRTALLADNYLAIVPARNQSMFVNYILRPRSDLLFSVEYRHLRTFNITGAPATADHVGVAAGFLF